MGKNAPPRPGLSTNGDSLPRKVKVAPAAESRGEEFVGRPLDKNTIGKLYNALSTKLIKVLTAQLGLHCTPEIVEDAVMETFGYLTARAEEGRPLVIEKDAFCWLASGVERRIAERGEREAARPEEGDDALCPAGDSTADPAQRRPLSIMVGAEQLGVVEQAMTDLNEKEREILGLVMNERLDLKEVAERLGIPHEDARKACARARRKLDDARGRWSSSFIHEADSHTYKPRTRKAVLQAIHMLPKESRDVIEERYVRRRPDGEAARILGLSLEAFTERLCHAEKLFAWKYGMKVPEDLEAILREDRRP